MLDWSSNFKRFFEDFWSQNGPSRGGKNRLKMRFFGTWAPRPPQRPPGSLQEAILEPFWTIFGAILVPKIAPQTSTSIQNHFLASLPFPPAAIFEPPDLIFSYFRTSGAHFQAPWPVWGAAHWRSGHGALVAPEGPLAKRMED